MPDPDDYIDEVSAARESYDWDDLAKDLAMLTDLTYMQAYDLIGPLEQEALLKNPNAITYPYDLLRPLRKIVNNKHDYRLVGQGLRDLAMLRSGAPDTNTT